MFEDIKAIYRNDPAVKNIEFLLYPGLHAIVMHRYLIHPLYILRIPLLPRLLSQIMRFLTRFLAPALLTKFGDDRQRFSQPASVQALAGTCPVTAASGKRRVVKFRRACDREFRNIAQQWAISSKPKSLWASIYWEQVRPHCNSDSHAYRCLANRWLAIAWNLWQTRQPYDEAYHLQQRARRSRPRR